MVACIFVVCAALLCIYYFFDPSQSAWMPRCAFHELTGLRCIGCGSQRAIYSALHGDFATAMHYNAALVITLPLLALYAFSELMRAQFTRLYAFLYSRTAIAILLLLVAGWWIGRNIAGI